MLQNDCWTGSNQYVLGSSSTEDMLQGGYDRDLLNLKWCGKGKWGAIHHFFQHESSEASNTMSTYHTQNNAMHSQAVEHLEEGCHCGCKSLHKFSKRLGS